MHSISEACSATACKCLANRDSCFYVKMNIKIFIFCAILFYGSENIDFYKYILELLFGNCKKNHKKN